MLTAGVDGEKSGGAQSQPISANLDQSSANRQFEPEMADDNTKMIVNNTEIGFAMNRLALVAVVVTLLLAGCSGSDDDLASVPNADAGAEDSALQDGSAQDGSSQDGTGEAGSEVGSGESGPDGSGNAGDFADPGEDELGFSDSELDFGPDNIETGELPEVSVPELAEPEDLLPELEAEVGEAVQQAVDSPDVDVLDVADLPDITPTDEEIASFGDGHRRTPTGRLIVLDELASLACANVEIALGAIDEGDTATAKAHISSAGERAGNSEVEGVQSWSEPLNEAAATDPIDATTLVGFLSVCLEGGYVI